MKYDGFHDLVIFVQIAESGSFTSAARHLGLTPSTVSKAVARLEEKYRARLFNRSTHFVRISEEGRVLLERATRVVDAMREADGLAETFSSSAAGQLRVYALPSFALYQLAPHLPEFLAANPAVSVDIELGTDPPDTVTSDLDIILRYGMVEDSTLVSRKIADSGWVVCASPAYIDRCGIPAQPGDLIDHNCLGFSLRRSTVSWAIDTADGLREVHGNASSNQAPMLRELALAGLGIIRVADFVVAGDLRSGRLVQVLADHQPSHNEPIYALYQQQPAGAQRVRTFVNFLHRKFSRRPWEIAPESLPD